MVVRIVFLHKTWAGNVELLPEDYLKRWPSVDLVRARDVNIMRQLLRIIDYQNMWSETVNCHLVARISKASGAQETIASKPIELTCPFRPVKIDNHIGQIGYTARLGAALKRDIRYRPNKAEVSKAAKAKKDNLQVRIDLEKMKCAALLKPFQMGKQAWNFMHISHRFITRVNRKLTRGLDYITFADAALQIGFPNVSGLRGDAIADAVLAERVLENVGKAEVAKFFDSQNRSKWISDRFVLWNMEHIMLIERGIVHEYSY